MLLLLLLPLLLLGASAQCSGLNVADRDNDWVFNSAAIRTLLGTTQCFVANPIGVCAGDACPEFSVVLDLQGTNVFDSSTILVGHVPVGADECEADFEQLGDAYSCVGQSSCNAGPVDFALPPGRAPAVRLSCTSTVSHCDWQPTNRIEIIPCIPPPTAAPTTAQAPTSQAPTSQAPTLLPGSPTSAPTPPPGPWYSVSRYSLAGCGGTRLTLETGQIATYGAWAELGGDAAGSTCVSGCFSTLEGSVMRDCAATEAAPSAGMAVYAELYSSSTCDAGTVVSHFSVQRGCHAVPLASTHQFEEWGCFLPEQGRGDYSDGQCSELVRRSHARARPDGTCNGGSIYYALCEPAANNAGGIAAGVAIGAAVLISAVVVGVVLYKRKHRDPGTTEFEVVTTKTIV